MLVCVQDRLQTRCTQCRRYGRKLQSMMQELRGLARATIAAVHLEMKKKAPLVSDPVDCEVQTTVRFKHPFVHAQEVDIDTLEQQTLQDGPALGRQQQDAVTELGAGYRRMQTALETGVMDKSRREFIHELKELCTKQNYLVCWSVGLFMVDRAQISLC